MSNNNPIRMNNKCEPALDSSTLSIGLHTGEASSCVEQAAIEAQLTELHHRKSALDD
jgi:hypothetical protein